MEEGYKRQISSTNVKYLKPPNYFTPPWKICNCLYTKMTSLFEHTCIVQIVELPCRLGAL